MFVTFQFIKNCHLFTILFFVHAFKAFQFCDGTQSAILF